MSITFVDKSKNAHIFRHAFFWESDGPPPPALPGCYLLLSKVMCPDHGNGSHTVVYAGESKNLKKRMRRHAKERLRWDDAKRWPFEILYTQDTENLHLANDLKYREKTPRCTYERYLHYLFTPPLSRQYDQAVNGGLKDGHLSDIILDLNAGRLSWFSHALQAA